MELKGWLKISPINSSNEIYRAIFSESTSKNKRISATLVKDDKEWKLVINVAPYIFNIHQPLITKAKEEAEIIIFSNIGEL